MDQSISQVSSLGTRLKNLQTHITERGFGSAAALAWYKLRAAAARSELGWKLCFENNPLIATGNVEDYSTSAETVWRELQGLERLSCHEFQLDIAAYQDYVKRAGYEQFDPYYRGEASGNAEHRSEKLLQHFISLELLDMQADDVYIDIASNTSPMRHIVKALYGCTVYSLDLSYPPGIDGELIGADAGAMPFPDESVSKMTLHCSFEHFAFGADSRFITECARVLRPGGKVCIVPWYVLPEYCIRLDPMLEQSMHIRDTEGAKVVYVRDYRVDYGRFYSPATVASRLLAFGPTLRFSAYRVRGLEQLKPELAYSELALCIEKPLL